MSTPASPLALGAMPAVTTTQVSSPLVRDYLAGKAALAPFFAGHPSDLAAYRRKAQEVDARLDAAARRRVGDAIRPLSEGAARRLEQVLAGKGYFVTTGQQTGLFTGPLYTVVKALSAIRLAAELERQLARPVLALFWSAADDHDWDEVDHVSVIDAHNYVRRIALPPEPDAPPVAMSHRPLPAAIQIALDDLRAALPDTPYRDALMQQLRGAYQPGRSMAAAFEETLAWVLAGLDVAIVSAAHPLVKQHSAAVIGRALREHGAQEAAVLTQTERLHQAGYPAQVSVATGASNVFLQTPQARDRLVRDGDGWLLRRGRERFTDEQLAARLAAEPGAFSPNVLLRPVVESALFPTLAYVGGPAETSYFAQIGCLFVAHGITPPLAVPRHSATVVEPGVERALARQGVALEEVRRPFEELVARLVKEELPPALTGRLAALRQSLEQGFDGLAAAARDLDDHLLGPVRAARNQALARTRELERRITQQVRRRQETRFEQLRRAAANLYPDDSPQERVLNVLPYLARYGPALLQRMLEEMTVELDGSHPGYGVECNREVLAARENGGIA